MTKLWNGSVVSITWSDLVRLEPRLMGLQREMKAIVRESMKKGESLDVLALWYGGDDATPGVREKLSRLVGYDRTDHPVLGTETAYDVAYEKLFAELNKLAKSAPCR